MQLLSEYQSDKLVTTQDILNDRGNAIASQKQCVARNNELVTWLLNMEKKYGNSSQQQ